MSLSLRNRNYLICYFYCIAAFVRADGLGFDCPAILFRLAKQQVASGTFHYSVEVPSDEERAVLLNHLAERIEAKAQEANHGLEEPSARTSPLHVLVRSTESNSDRVRIAVKRTRRLLPERAAGVSHVQAFRIRGLEDIRQHLEDVATHLDSMRAAQKPIRPRDRFKLLSQTVPLTIVGALATAIGFAGVTFHRPELLFGFLGGGIALYWASRQLASLRRHSIPSDSQTVLGLNEFLDRSSTQRPDWVYGGTHYRSPRFTQGRDWRTQVWRATYTLQQDWDVDWLFDNRASVPTLTYFFSHPQPASSRWQSRR